MPRQATQQIKGARKQASEEKKAYFRGSASPQSSYQKVWGHTLFTRNVTRESPAAQLARALGIADRSLGAAVQAEQRRSKEEQFKQEQIQKQEDMAKGATDGSVYDGPIKQGILPADVSPAYQKSFMESLGNRNGRRYGIELEEKYYSEFPDFNGTIDDWLALQHQQELQGIPDVYYGEALVPHLDKAEANIRATHLEIRVREAKEKAGSAVFTNIFDSLTDLKGQEMSPEQFEGIYETGRMMHLRNKEIDDSVYKAIDAYAMTGHPEAWEVTKRPKKDGTPGMFSKWGDKITLRQQAALAVKVRKFKEAEEAEQKAFETVGDKKILSLWDSATAMATTGDFSGYASWEAGLQDYINSPYVDASKATRLLNYRTKLQDEWEAKQKGIKDARDDRDKAEGEQAHKDILFAIQDGTPKEEILDMLQEHSGVLTASEIASIQGKLKDPKTQLFGGDPVKLEMYRGLQDAIKGQIPSKNEWGGVSSDLQIKQSKAVDEFRLLCLQNPGVSVEEMIKHSDLIIKRNKPPETVDQFETPDFKTYDDVKEALRTRRITAGEAKKQAYLIKKLDSLDPKWREHK